ncbi:MAG: AI-2E family transporter [Tissierellia bacterium]|nr:AI-2E family transporter [Tissierellia bacterium]
MERFNPPIFLYKVTWILSIILLILIIYYLINIGNNFVPERKKIRIKDKKILPIILSIVFIYLFFALLNKYTILSDTFFTIIFSAILAYLFNPIINFLESKNINRMIGVILLYLGILCFLLIFALLVIPRSSSEIKGLMNNMPEYIEKISKVMDEIYNKYYSTIGELPPLFQGVQQVVMENIVGFEHMIMDGLKSFIGGILKTFSKFVSLVLTPILTFYFLVDKNYFKEKFMNLIPKKNREEYRKLFLEIDRSMSLFVRGRIIMAAYVGVVTAIILSILRIDFALLIGFITGIADIIPYIGPFLGFLPAAFFAYLDSPIKAIWVSILFVLIQWVENNILAPKILGDSTGLHPLIVLISIIIGGGIFGVLGMILAVPVVAISIILFKFLRKKLNIPSRMQK